MKSLPPNYFNFLISSNLSEAAFAKLVEGYEDSGLYSPNFRSKFTPLFESANNMMASANEHCGSRPMKYPFISVLNSVLTLDRGILFLLSAEYSAVMYGAWPGTLVT